MKMSSNRLDHLGDILGVGRKIKHSGFNLWIQCMAGDKKAWEEMRDYAVQDVRLLEAVFGKLLPWVKGLNYGLYTSERVCTNCGIGGIDMGLGEVKTQTTRYKAWECGQCGTWNKGAKIKL